MVATGRYRSALRQFLARHRLRGTEGVFTTPRLTASVSDDLEPDPDALPAEALSYPDLDVGDGVGADGSVDATVELDFDSAAEWLHELADAVGSHDLGFTGDSYRGIYGVGPREVSVSFDPDADHTGELEVSFRFGARTMQVDDADAPKVGARGGKGFIPLAMLTGDRETDQYLCYNWVEEPTPESPGDTDEVESDDVDPDDIEPPSDQNDTDPDDAETDAE